MFKTSVFVSVAVRCPLLQAPANGAVSCSNRDPNETVFGSDCSFTCEQGHDLHGHVHVTCNLHGNWTGVAPRCEGTWRIWGEHISAVVWVVPRDANRFPMCDRVFPYFLQPLLFLRLCWRRLTWVWQQGALCRCPACLSRCGCWNDSDRKVNWILQLTCIKVFHRNIVTTVIILSFCFISSR